MGAWRGVGQQVVATARHWPGKEDRIFESDDGVVGASKQMRKDARNAEKLCARRRKASRCSCDLGVGGVIANGKRQQTVAATDGTAIVGRFAPPLLSEWR